jgi:Skp family chaperone for outer membrane proteins
VIRRTLDFIWRLLAGFCMPRVVMLSAEHRLRLAQEVASDLGQRLAARERDVQRSEAKLAAVSEQLFASERQARQLESENGILTHSLEVAAQEIQTLLERRKTEAWIEAVKRQGPGKDADLL